MKLSQKAAVFASLASITTATICRPKIDSKQLQADITKEGLWANLVALNDIASANGGNRAFGLPGYAASVDYVFDRISKVPGPFKAWKQDLPALFNQVEAIELTVADGSIYVYGLSYSPSTSAEGITAELVAGPEGVAGCDQSSYDGLDVAGKIVLVQRWRCPTGGTLAGRMLPAARAGAVGVLIYNDITTNVTAGTLSAPNPEYVPSGFINMVDGLRLKERLAAGEKLETHFQQTQIIETRITQNVMVETVEGDPDNVIMLGAHLDSVQAGPGINDDGSGSSLLLELFLAFSKYRTRNKVRFAWWAAEENGLLGSRYYCSNLEATEADKLLAYLNFDMVSKGYFGVGDTDGSSYGSVAPPGSEVIERLFVEHFESQGITVMPAIITNGSDYASFWQVLNKPFGYLHTGTGVAQDPCYHQACDTIDNPDPEMLTINAKAAAHLLTVLSLNGTSLIPKSSINATMFADIRMRDVGPDIIRIEELEALGEKHLGCGHDV
ncbi:aminopeptidase Y [Bombardia bombarda]|uniref:Peptide hydrolase n=1 Tax=Bombardia bombarda TaxID=252184 RepID=A0AA40BV99_9PEZI|nr:aminopeptidase Y [Bombardia bombarda]